MFFPEEQEINSFTNYFSDFTDSAEYWSFPFESPSLSADLEDAWEEIKPLYELLLTYVRRRLREYYGPERISRQAPLPSHILGNMWAQSWNNIFDITQPYPGQTFLDVTPEMRKQVSTEKELTNEIVAKEQKVLQLSKASKPKKRYVFPLQ